MKYFEVAVADRGLKTHQTLTYSSEEQFVVGQLVRVKIRNRAKNGFVVSEVSKPEYKTSPIDKLLEGQPIPSHLIELAQWMAVYYAVDLGTAAGLLIPQGAEKTRRAAKPKPAPAKTKQKHSLTDKQLKIVTDIEAKSGTHLVRGVTGSGKTRIYIELAKKARKSGKAAIIMVPEIGLTSQMVDEVLQYMSDEVFVIHSNQSEADRHKQWLAIQTAKCPLVIGPRSALFSPISNLGLVVIDEEHEPSYKQEISPKYNAVRVASRLRQLTESTLVLG